MIVKEFYRTREDGVNLYRTYSDINMMLLQNETGDIYAEAIDVENAPYTYTETDNPVEDAEATDEDYKSALMDLGVTFDA